MASWLSKAVMLQLRISDKLPSGCLAFDLRDVLRALGPEALGWTWVVSGVGRETVMATGAGADALEDLERCEAGLTGSSLFEIAARTHQVIWGDFRAFSDDRREEPQMRIIAFDSTWYDVLCNDEAILAKVASAFKDTKRIDPQTAD